MESLSSALQQVQQDKKYGQVKIVELEQLLSSTTFQLNEFKTRVTELETALNDAIVESDAKSIQLRNVESQLQELQYHKASLEVCAKFSSLH